MREFFEYSFTENYPRVPRYYFYQKCVRIVLPRVAHDDDLLLLDGFRPHESVGKKTQSSSYEEAIHEAKHHRPSDETTVPRSEARVIFSIQKRDAKKKEDDGVAGSCQRLGEIFDGVVRLFRDVVTNVLPL